MKKGWKRFGLSLVAATAIISLAACGSDSKKEGGSSKDEVVVDVFQFKVEFNNQFKEAAKVYEKENPGVKINISTVGGGDDYGAALKTKFASGEEPDIFNIGGPEDLKTWQKSLADVSDTKSAKEAIDGTLNAVTKDDKVLGLPYNMEGYGLLYNKEVFKKAGIKTEDIKTQADLRKAVEKIDKDKKKLGLDAVFAFPAKETWITGLHGANLFIAPEFDNDVNKAYEAKKLEFKYSDQFKEYIDLQQKYSVQPTTSLDYSKQMEELFSNEKVALTQQGNWVFGTIDEINPEFAEEGVGILPIPIDGASEQKLPVGVPNYWAFNKNSKDAEQKEAKKFIDWLNTSDAGKKAVLEEFKFIPAYNGYDTAKIADPLSKEVYEYSSKGNTTGWVFMGYPTDWGMNVLGAGIQKYVSDETSWDDLMTDVKKQWDSSRQ
ncbi:ABC transporter substrate-binding protein [Vagococcus carniphilus]|uniref:ABC transporter substrate-binding protein n=1 Tax=Vagococcus carniphilus TaxID=218144 RepID=A0AAW8U2Z7_9ENTE|nr:ABC transporter substrate-binding protein [Vagococcus carniphilus]MDT2832672.1 ABC transporter substrate-binding protein [Vagococcus carniphilus]MDT2849523.1 ABC transporter substrate-binding protein [Vagococcus carniphilus]MDT2864785.1 ABC transporter substrate-binding protein [Vagococcus carniphilus]